MTSFTTTQLIISRSRAVFPALEHPKLYNSLAIVHHVMMKPSSVLQHILAADAASSRTVGAVPLRLIHYCCCSCDCFTSVVIMSNLETYFFYRVLLCFVDYEYDTWREVMEVYRRKLSRRCEDFCGALIPSLVPLRFGDDSGRSTTDKALNKNYIEKVPLVMQARIAASPRSLDFRQAV